MRLPRIPLQPARQNTDVAVGNANVLHFASMKSPVVLGINGSTISTNCRLLVVASRAEATHETGLSLGSTGGWAVPGSRWQVLRAFRISDVATEQNRSDCERKNGQTHEGLLPLNEKL